MKKKLAAVVSLIVVLVMAFALTGCGSSNSSTAAVNDSHEHALAGAVENTPSVPSDRLYGIITYGGEDHLIVAEEHKEADHYGREYIHYLIDTDGVDGSEPAPVDMYFECPVCGSHSHATIRVGDDSTGRVFWCKCENPWIIGLTVTENELQ